MIQKAIYSVFILAVMIFTACDNKSADNLQEETNSGVVLIKTESFYELRFGHDVKAFFSSLNENEGLKDLSFDEDSIKTNTSYGTGFFVSQTGLIATNYHVVESTTAKQEIYDKWDDVRNMIRQYCSDRFDQIETAKEQIKQKLLTKFIYEEDVSEERFYIDQIESEEQQLVALYQGIENLSTNNATLTFHANISIAYNDNHVTSGNDFTECVMVNEDEKNDLALIQLKDKKTPIGKYVFSVSNENPLETYTWIEKVERKLGKDKNATLFMNGFNMGPAIGITSEGLKSQFNQGTISQKTNDRIMYSIPALPGSSGSPIINKKGELVAINFAGIKNAQTFNYGIRVKWLRKLVRTIVE